MRIAQLGISIDSTGAKKGADETTAALRGVTQAATSTTAAVSTGNTKSGTSYEALAKSMRDQNKAANEAIRASRDLTAQRAADTAAVDRNAAALRRNTLQHIEALALNQKFDASQRSVAGASVLTESAFNRIRSALTPMASQLIGASGSAGVLTSTLGSLALGAGPMVAILAGIAAVTAAWKFFTKDATEAADATKRAADELRDWYREKNNDGPGVKFRNQIEQEIKVIDQMTKSIETQRNVASTLEKFGFKFTAGLVTKSANRKQADVVDRQNAVTAANEQADADAALAIRKDYERVDQLQKDAAKAAADRAKDAAASRDRARADEEREAEKEAKRLQKRLADNLKLIADYEAGRTKELLTQSDLREAREAEAAKAIEQSLRYNEKVANEIEAGAKAIESENKKRDADALARLYQKARAIKDLADTVKSLAQSIGGVGSGLDKAISGLAAAVSTISSSRAVLNDSSSTGLEKAGAYGAIADAVIRGVRAFNSFTGADGRKQFDAAKSEFDRIVSDFQEKERTVAADVAKRHDEQLAEDLRYNDAQKAIWDRSISEQSQWLDRQMAIQDEYEQARREQQRQDAAATDSAIADWKRVQSSFNLGQWIDDTFSTGIPQLNAAFDAFATTLGSVVGAVEDASSAVANFLFSIGASKLFGSGSDAVGDWLRSLPKDITTKPVTARDITDIPALPTFSTPSASFGGGSATAFDVSRNTVTRVSGGLTEITAVTWIDLGNRQLQALLRIEQIALRAVVSPRRLVDSLSQDLGYATSLESQRLGA